MTRRVIAVLGTALGLSVTASSACRAQPPGQPLRILVVYGVSPEMLDVGTFSRNLRSTVRGEVSSPVEFYQEYLDLDRFPGRDAGLVGYFAEKYRDFRIDAIVVIGSVALRFATAHLSTILPGVPVVFALTIGSQIDLTTLPAHVTGRVMSLPFDSILSMAQGLQPDAERLAIIGGTSRIDSVAVDAAARANASRSRPLPVVLLRGLTYEALLGRLHALPPRTIGVVAYFRRDQRGQTFIPGEVIPDMVRASSAPLYGYSRNVIGQGIVGGAIILPEAEGIATGKLVMEVLRRAPGAALPRPIASGTTFITDLRQLRRWGLSESRLPPGTQVLYREPGLWARYRVAILASMAVIVLQAMLIALLLVERTRRRRAQLALHDQMIYEQTIAELTAHAAHHAPDETVASLEYALARIGSYAGASAAVLVEFGDGTTRPALPMSWTPSTGDVTRRAIAAACDDDAATLQIPLLSGWTRLGMLTLYRPGGDQPWSPQLVCRLGAAAEVVAGAMARARAMRAARASEELNRAVLASFSAGIAILDRAGVIIRVNEAWRELARQGHAGAQRDGAFVGWNYLDECRRAETQGSRDAREVRSGIEAVLQRRSRQFRHEYHWSSPDVRWCELRVDPMEHEDGGAIVTHLDITERRLAELKSDETRRQVAHMGRVAIVGELAATVSHELRQPLAAIRANAESGLLLMSRHPIDVEEAMQVFREIVHDDVRAAELIDNTRMFLRKETPRAASLDLNDVCRQAVQMLHRNALLRRAHLMLALDVPLPPVHGDPVQLQQVVLNLVLNALDAIATSSDERSVTVRTAVRDGEVELSVRDSGPGLPPDVQDHLFESFYSTKTHGLGMGLVIVRSIVERHEGRIFAENHDAGGALFRVLLPVSAPVRAPMMADRAQPGDVAPV